MKTLLWIALILFIAVATLHAMADKPPETQAQRDQAAQATMAEARKAYNIKSDDEKYEDYLEQQHEDDKAAQQGEY